MNKNLILIVGGLFAVYFIIKWTCRLLFGLLDYALLIVVILGIVWYLQLPPYRKRELQDRTKQLVQSLFKS